MVIVIDNSVVIRTRNSYYDVIFGNPAATRSWNSVSVVAR